MVNNVVIQGRLAADPVSKFTDSNVALANFRVACQRDNKEKSADFFNVTAWRNSAEFVTKWFRKGDEVLVVGRLQNRTWTADSGENRTTTEIVASAVYFAGRRGEERTDMGYQQAAEKAAGNAAGFAEIDDSEGDLPF